MYVAMFQLNGLENLGGESSTAKRLNEIFSALADKRFWDVVPFCQPEKPATRICIER